ncbi:MAG: DUF4832 domain-containing protein [Butyrivibrio sp.]|nr:DUF4832 domain-containing protein [Butyrivibrio sp.]
MKKFGVSLIVLVIAFIIVVGIYMFFFRLNRKEYTFKYDESVINNPLMGYAPDAGNEELCENTSLVYAYITWADLEPEEGEYDWEYFEAKNNIARWKKEGKHLVFRFVCDYPGSETHMDIPKWLYDITGDGEFYDFEYGRGYCPDYNNDVFIEKHTEVIKEIGRYFGEDDFLAYVELGSLGHWGEWHTFYPAGIPKMPLTDVREKYVEAYTESFPNARLLMRRPFAELPDGAGVFNDMTGAEEDTKDWLEWIKSGGEYDSTGEKDAIIASPEIWNAAPVGGEFTSSIEMSYMLDNNFDSTEKLIRESHMTFIGPKVPDLTENPELEEAANEILKSVGYKYWISSAQKNDGHIGDDNSYITLTVENSGVAPIYFNWKMFLYAAVEKDGENIDISPIETIGNLNIISKYEVDLDLTSIYQDQSAEAVVSVPSAIANQNGVSFYVGIEDPSTNLPAVRLNMKTTTVEGYSKLF